MTEQELVYKQALPLETKVKTTESRIREWVAEFGVDGTFVSFSGGKDSTVLLHIARGLYPDMPAVFCDTGLEYPEIREFVKTFDNVEWIKPNKTFPEVIDYYGYPFISKQVANCLQTGKNFLENREDYKDRPPLPVQNPDDEYKPYALLLLEGKIKNGRSPYNCKKYKFMLDAPYRFSSRCCRVMKKNPFDCYMRRTKRVPILAQLACESHMRKTTFLKQGGCNAFDAKKPVSNPMGFWTEQDILGYIRENNIAIAPVYGEVVEEDGELRTTGMDRTGCMFCGFGCHLEKGEGRFALMKESHPKVYDYLMRPRDEGGLEYKNIIDWINEHSDLDIKY